ncbi:hypothetical protein [Flindersiella endophytica]
MTAQRRLRTTTKAAVATAAAAALLMLLAGCANTEPNAGEREVTKAPSPAKTDSRPSESGETTTPAEPTPKQNLPAGMPNVIGKGLAAAKQQLNQAGHTVLSHDATPRGRVQLDLRGWQVCFQTVEKDTTSKQKQHVELGVVALDEDCPASDQSLTPATVASDGTLPDFKGRGLAEATQALGRKASVRPVDATGEDRNVLWEKDWQVCAQSPAPGTKWTGQPIRFDVVRWNEKCP